MGMTESTASAAREDAVYTARPSVDGALYVDGRDLYARNTGKQVQLRGLSSHGLTWFPGFINEKLIGQISKEWNCNLLRLAMYSEQYCGGKKEENLELVRKGIDCAVKSDMYVILDWHILRDSNPNDHIEEAKDFFKLIASEYKDDPHIIYEICNVCSLSSAFGL